MENDKLKEILQYYHDTYSMEGSTVEEVYSELMENNVEVNGDSFFCPIYNEQLQATILLAGTKEKANIWLLKKIIRVLRSGDRVFTVLNGNSDNILPQLEKYGSKVFKRDGDVSYIQFN